MKKLRKILKKLRIRPRVIALAAGVLVLLAAGAVTAGAVFSSPLVEFPPAKAAARSGACMFPDGGWTIVDCSNAAAASSAALHSWSRYVAQCGVDSRVATGTSTASAQLADANDGYLPAGAWLEFMTTDDVKYFSCLNIGSDSDCRIIECL